MSKGLIFATLILLTVVLSCAYSTSGVYYKFRHDVLKVRMITFFDDGLISTSSGTAFIFEQTNNTTRLLTAAHVVDKPTIPSTLSVLHVVVDKKESYIAKVLLLDTKLDLAIIEINKRLNTYSRFRDSACDDLTGSRVFSIGYPFMGLIGKVVVNGSITSTDQVCNLRNSNKQKNCMYSTLPIGKGASGSPVYDSSGSIVGMVVGIVTHTPNYSVLVDLKTIKSFIKRFKTIFN